MERKNLKNEKNIIYLLYVIFIVGIIGHLVPITKPVMLLLTPYTLLFNFILVIATLKLAKSELYYLIFIILATLLIEIIGIKYSIIFGSYFYGEVLGLKIKSVPVIIGFNWAILIIASINLSEKLYNFFILKLNQSKNENKKIKRKVFIDESSTKIDIIKSVIAGILLVIFDLFLEPVATKLGYWYWDFNKIPIQNYIAWFVIAIIFSLIFYKNKIKIKSLLILHYLLLQFAFFVILFLLI